MKKLLLLILSLTLTMGILGSCGAPGDPINSSSPTESTPSESVVTTTCTVTFKQSGQEDVTKTVVSGSALTDIPTPQARVGYTVEWEDVDLSNVTENITVNAVETANEYTVTYDADGGTVTPATQKVTYDSVPTLATPEKEGYTFTGWLYEGNAVVGEWTIASNVTLKASWVEETPDMYTVTFSQAGQAPIVYTNVEAGSNFTNIPEPVAKTGYNVSWKSEQLALLNNISGNVTVEAVEEAKTYTVTLELNGGTLGEASTTVSVTYDQAYELPTPTLAGYEFVGWAQGEQTMPAKGVWANDGNVTLSATWKRVTYTVTLVLNGGTLAEEVTTIKVTYGEAYELPEPTRGDDYTFVGWKLNVNNKVIANKGVWEYEGENMTLTAQWREGGWTDNY